jgi:ketosteroid isomerase-like protein
MIKQLKCIIAVTAILLVCFGSIVTAQRTRERKTQDWCNPQTGLNGLYRIDFDRSDALYSVLEGASSRVPFGEQQQFFIDLSVRLAPPDLLAIECREKRVSLASSRAARVEFVADGVTRNARMTNGDAVRTRIWLDQSGLVFTSSGGGSDNVNFSFTPIDGGRALRVTRRISARELIEPVVIQSVYNKIGTVARWDIFEGEQVAEQTGSQNTKPDLPNPEPRRVDRMPQNETAENLRQALSDWIAATNNRSIERQMAFYMPQLKAFYLTRNVSSGAVRAEKNRAFAAAKSIDIRAAEPEIVFQNGGREAIMRFRKVYNIQNNKQSRRGEVIQELRWQRTNRGWKIFSERDIKVLR